MNDKTPVTQQACSPDSTPAGVLANPARRHAVRHSICYLLVGAGLAVVAALTPRRAHAYYGRCYYCNCCNFMGSENTCSNCGHSYENHSGQTCNQANL
jgi:hypothetical protein